MQLNALTAALTLLTALAAASPIALTARDFNCNVENVRCCEQVLTQHEAAKQLGALLVLPGDLIGNIGISCSAVGISALSKCKSSPVCCSQVSQGGLVNAGCTPLSVL